MVSSTGGIRHADGGDIGRSLAVAATLHCTMNTGGFLPLFFIASRRRIKWRSLPVFSIQYCAEEPLFNTEHGGYTETVKLLSPLVEVVALVLPDDPERRRYVE